MPDHRRSARREMDESHAHLARLPVGAAWVAFGAGIVGRQPGWLSALAINRVAAIAIGCFATVLLGRLADSIFN